VEIGEELLKAPLGVLAAFDFTDPASLLSVGDEFDFLEQPSADTG